MTWSANSIIVSTNNANQAVTFFAITDTKLDVPVVTLLTHGNAKRLEQLKSGFKRTVNWNEYQSNVTTQKQNQYLDYLIDPSFQGVNRLFGLSYEDNPHRKNYKRFFLPMEEPFLVSL